MTRLQSTTYGHTQASPLCLILYAAAAWFFALTWFLQKEPWVSVVLALAGFVMLVVAASFQRLTVEDEGEHLLIHFGPLPLFRKRVRYADIREVETGRTTFFDGWGIHWSPWGGWLWNVWGYDCVVIRLEKRVLRVGTDDPQGLAEFLRSRIALAR